MGGLARMGHAVVGSSFSVHRFKIDKSSLCCNRISAIICSRLPLPF